MSSVAYAKFTFFEAATQHGYVVALMASKMERSKHKFQIVVDPARGRVFQLIRTADPAGKPFFEFLIPDRSNRESQAMWRVRCTKELEQAWKEQVLAPKDTSGTDTAASPTSPASPPTASSTDAPPASETSNSESAAVESEPTDSAPSPQKTRRKGRSAGSSKNSKPASSATA